MSKKSDQPKLPKKGNTKREGEGQLYDKIMRENLQQLFLPLVIEELNFKLKSFQPLPDKQPTTVIRETDAFLLIETYSKDEPKFILHLEFESKDDAEMIYRMSEYHGIELRKYRLPIKHVVVYLGEKTPKMRTKLEPSEVFESFTLVNARNFSPQKWLDEEEPSKVIMAILGDYQKKNAVLILNSIFDKLRKVCKTNVELKKYIDQLIIISRMRNLEELTVKLSEAMPVTIDLEKDFFYRLGFKKAEDTIKKANKRAEQIAKEKAKVTKEKEVLKAKAIKAAKEKEALKIKATKEKATLVAKAAKAAKEKELLKAKAIKAVKEKEVLKIKVTKEKEALKVKATKEKATLIAKAAKEKELLKAKAIKAAKEKEALKIKATKEKATLVAKAAKEKELLKIKATKEKATLIAKAAKEKAIFIAKIKASIQKMQANTTFSNEEIMEFLNLDKKTFKQYIKEIKEDQK